MSPRSRHLLFQAAYLVFLTASRWDLSPGFAGRSSIDIARPIEEPCLQCHATGPRLIAGHAEKYADPPFLETGVGCDAATAPAGRISKRSARTPRSEPLSIPQNSTLPAETAYACNATSRAQPGRPLPNVRVRLSAWPAFFPTTWLFLCGRRPTPFLSAATDHAEQLSASKCRQASSDRLWCGSCHDPHSEPPVSERAAVYRKACLTCHHPSDCKEGSIRSVSNDDCRTCHRPKRHRREGEHVAFTLHTIPKRPSQARAEKGELKPFFPAPPMIATSPWLTPRYLLKIPRSAREPLPFSKKPRARTSLTTQSSLRNSPSSRHERPAEGSRRPLPSSPGHRILRIPIAAANLGMYADARRRHEANEAVQDVFNRYPSLIGPGLNLAIAQSNAGNTSASENNPLRIS